MKFTLEHINKYVKGQLIGNKDLLIEGVSEINNSHPKTITFLGNSLYKKFLKNSNASAFLVSNKSFLDETSSHGIVVNNPQLAMAITLKLFYPTKKAQPFISPQSIIEENVTLGKDVTIHSGAVIKKGVNIGNYSEVGSNSVIQENTEIGENCKIFSNVTLYNNIKIMDNVKIHSGTVIGADGFGFINEKQSIIKIPQTGDVVIESNVEIGSNCSIDRATIGSTLIGESTKIDNLVHIAHNVKIGKNCFITAQVGIAGSTVVDDHCSFGGQSGVTSHIKIGKNSLIAAQSGVTKSLEGNNTYAGYPARKIKEFHNREALIGQIKKIQQKLKKNR